MALPLCLFPKCQFYGRCLGHTVTYPRRPDFTIVGMTGQLSAGRAPSVNWPLVMDPPYSHELELLITDEVQAEDSTASLPD